MFLINFLISLHILDFNIKLKVSSNKFYYGLHVILYGAYIQLSLPSSVLSRRKFVINDLYFYNAIQLQFFSSSHVICFNEFFFFFFNFFLISFQDIVYFALCGGIYIGLKLTNTCISVPLFLITRLIDCKIAVFSIFLKLIS